MSVVSASTSSSSTSVTPPSKSTVPFTSFPPPPPKPKAAFTASNPPAKKTGIMASLRNFFAHDENNTIEDDIKHMLTPQATFAQTQARGSTKSSSSSAKVARITTKPPLSLQSLAGKKEEVNASSLQVPPPNTLARPLPVPSASVQPKEVKRSNVNEELNNILKGDMPPSGVSAFQTLCKSLPEKTIPIHRDRHGNKRVGFADAPDCPCKVVVRNEESAETYIVYPMSVVTQDGMGIIYNLVVQEEIVDEQSFVRSWKAQAILPIRNTPESGTDLSELYEFMSIECGLGKPGTDVKSNFQFIKELITLHLNSDAETSLGYVSMPKDIQTAKEINLALIQKYEKAKATHSEITQETENPVRLAPIAQEGSRFSKGVTAKDLAQSLATAANPTPVEFTAIDMLKV